MRGSRQGPHISPPLLKGSEVSEPNVRPALLPTCEHRAEATARPASTHPWDSLEMNILKTSLSEPARGESLALQGPRGLERGPELNYRACGFRS